MDFPSETSLCTVAPSPTDTPSPISSEVRGRLYTGYLEWLIHLQTVRQNWRIKVRRIVHSIKLRRITYLTRIIKRITRHGTAMIRLKRENVHFCCKWMPRPRLELSVRVSAFAFSQRLFLYSLSTFLTSKIILEVEYFIKSMVYQMLKFYKRMAYFIPRWS